MAPEQERRAIITPQIVETLLDQYKVPSNQRTVLRDIIDLFLANMDDQRAFGQKAKEYTERNKVSVTEARAALLIFQRISTDIQNRIRQVSRDN